MLPTIHIRSDESSGEYATLLFCVGDTDCSYLITDTYQRALAMGIYHFTQPEDKLQHIRQVIGDNMLANFSFHKVHIVYTSPTALIIPQEFVSPSANTKMMDLVFGNDMGTTKEIAEYSYKHNHSVVFRVDEKCHELLLEAFPAANVDHVYSIMKDWSKNDELLCVVQNKTILTALKKDNTLQLVQQFDYRNPTDVLFHLINVCKAHDIALTKVSLTLYGMIDTDSNLYNELYKYFVNIGLGTLPNNISVSQGFKSYPEHYFAHILSIASCV